MGDEQRGLPPQLAGASEQLPPLLAVEPTAGLKDDQPHPGPEHGPPESYPLAFSARYQGAPSPSRVCSPSGSRSRILRRWAWAMTCPMGRDGRLVHRRTDCRGGAVPELHSRIDPGSLMAQLCEALAVERDTVNTNLACWPIPPEERPDQARLASP